jgi:hypothetical protein
LAAGVGLVVIGLYLALSNAGTWGAALASRGWSSTTGEVTTSDLFVVVNEFGETQEYGARVVYTYLVDGRRHESNRVSFGRGPLRSEGDITAVVNRYPEGNQVRVYYDPRAPGEAVLEPGMTGRLFLLMAGAAGGLLGGLGLAAAGLRGIRQPKAPEGEAPPVEVEWERGEERRW